VNHNRAATDSKSPLPARSKKARAKHIASALSCVMASATIRARLFCLLTLLCCAAASCLATATSFYVDQAVPSSGDGRSWATAFKTIGEGTGAAQTGDEVVVGQGTYVETVDFDGKGITVRSKDPANSQTVAATVIEFGDFPEVVRFWSGEDRASIIAGFTIASGQVGVSCAFSSPVIRDNIIVANTADFDQGGGISSYEASPLIENDVIASNLASDGGAGIACERGNPVIIGNLIIGNVADSDGGGILCIDCAPRIERNRIISNSSERDGGGISCRGCRAHICNNLIASNVARSAGGGIFAAASVLTILADTVVNNSTEGGGAGGVHLSDSTSMVQNCILWANTDDLFGAGAVFTCIENDGPDDQGEGNIHDNPGFEDPNGPDNTFGTQDDDYRLSSLSPCIDRASFTAGVTLSIAKQELTLALSWSPGLDLVGQDRVSGFGPDMGCYERQTEEPIYVLESSPDLAEWFLLHAGQDRTLSLELPHQDATFFRVSLSQE
jgi:hypothetical protein